MRSSAPPSFPYSLDVLHKTCAAEELLPSGFIDKNCNTVIAEARCEATMPQDEEWRILAKEAAEEKDPEKLMEIIEALTRALEEHELQKSHTNQ